MIYRQAPPSSAIVLATYPDASIWRLQEHLLAGILDAVRVANWQRGRARRHEYPDPIVRPGVEPRTQSIGSGAISMEEMADRLGWTDAMTPWRPQPDETEVSSG